MTVIKKEGTNLVITEDGKDDIAMLARNVYIQVNAYDLVMVFDATIARNYVQPFFTAPLSACTDAAGVAYTKSTLLTFAQSELGFSSAGSSALPTAPGDYYTRAQSDAKDATLSAADIASGALVGTDLVLTLKGGSTITIDATAMLADLRVTSGVYNTVTEALDFTLSDSSTISVPVTALLPVSTDATLSGDGATTELSVAFSSDAGNIATVGADGKVYVPITVVQTDGSLTGDGTTTQLSVALSANNNALVKDTDQTLLVPVAQDADVTAKTVGKMLDASHIIDEDDFASNSDLKVPTQQAVKAYTDRRDAYLASFGYFRRGMQVSFIAGTSRELKFSSGTFTKWDAILKQEVVTNIAAELPMTFSYMNSQGNVPALSTFTVPDATNASVLTNQQIENGSTGNITNLPSGDETAHMLFVHPLTGDKVMLLGQKAYDTGLEASQKFSSDTVIPAALAAYEYVGVVIVPFNSSNYATSDDAGFVPASHFGDTTGGGGSTSIEANHYLLVNNDTERNALTTQLVSGLTVGVLSSAENGNVYAEYRVLTAGATWAATTKQLVWPTLIAEGLRGAPVADNAELTALTARDYERRKVLADGKEYVFEFGAVTGTLEDDTNNGFWQEQVQGSDIFKQLSEWTATNSEVITAGNSTGVPSAIINDNKAADFGYYSLTKNLPLTTDQTVRLKFVKTAGNLNAIILQVTDITTNTSSVAIDSITGATTIVVAGTGVAPTIVSSTVTDNTIDVVITFPANTDYTTWVLYPATVPNAAPTVADTTLVGTQEILELDMNYSAPASEFDLAKFRAVSTANQSIPTAVNTVAITNTTSYDIGNNYNQTTGEFTAPSSGFYHFDYATRLEDQDGLENEAFCMVYVNGVENLRGGFAHSGNANNTGDFPYGRVSGDLQLSQGDVVTAVIRHDEAGARDLAGANFITYFSGHQLSTSSLVMPKALAVEDINRGSSRLAVTHDISATGGSGDFEDIGVSVTLPKAGTYELKAMIAAGQVGDDQFINGVITNALDVAVSEFIPVIGTTDTAALESFFSQGSAMIFAEVTTTTDNEVFKIRVAQNTNAALGQINAGTTLFFDQKPTKTVINTTDTPVNDQTTSGYMDIGTMRWQYFRITSNLDGPQGTTFPAPFADTNYSVIPQMTNIGTLSAASNVGVLGRVENLSTTGFDFNRDDDVSGIGEIMFIAMGLKPQ